MRGFAAAHESDLSGQFIATSATPKASLVRESYPKWPELWLRIYSKLPRSFVFPEICSSHSETIFAVLVGEFIVFHCVCFKGACFLLKVHHFDTRPLLTSLVCFFSVLKQPRRNISFAISNLKWMSQRKKSAISICLYFFVWGKS